MIEIPSTVVCSTAEAMHGLGIELGRMLQAGDLLVLTGPLGAGKTTLTRGIGEGLGVRGPVTSPTFVLARTHPNLSGGAPLVHVDAYRLADARELDDLDIDVERSVVVVEWGRGMLAGIAPSWLEVEIERPTGAADAISTAVPVAPDGGAASPFAPSAGEMPQNAPGAAPGRGQTWHLTSADGEGDVAEVADDGDEPRVVRIRRVSE